LEIGKFAGKKVSTCRKTDHVINECNMAGSKNNEMRPYSLLNSYSYILL